MGEIKALTPNPTHGVQEGFLEEMTPPLKKLMTLSFEKPFLHLASGIGPSPDFLPPMSRLLFWLLLLDPSFFLLPTRWTQVCCFCLPV